MNASLADSASVTESVYSCGTRLVGRNRIDVARGPRNTFYNWMFGLIHSKRLVILMQLFLLGIALWGLSYGVMIDQNSAYPPITGFDTLGIETPYYNANGSLDNSKGVKSSSQMLSDKMEKINIFCAVCCFYLFSVFCGVVGMSLAERAWANGQPICGGCFNPAVLLGPFLVAVVTIAAPLGIWSYRAILWQLARSANDSSFSGCIEALLHTFLPVTLFWIAFLYLLYGCVLGVLYIWMKTKNMRFRRGGKDAISSSWSFRERVLMGYKEGNENNRTRNFGLVSSLPRVNRLLAGGGSHRSNKSTDRPTLMAYRSRANDLNDSMQSNLSSGNISLKSEGSRGSSGEGEASRLGVLGRMLSSYASPQKRPLDTVVEEGESRETSDRESHNSRF